MTDLQTPGVDRRGGAGRTATIVVAVVVLVALAVAAWFLFLRPTAPSLTAGQLNAAPTPTGPSQTVPIPRDGPTLDIAALQGRIAAATTEAVGTAPTAVTCPDTVEVRDGATFTCSATVDGADIGYAVTQTDGTGTVDFAARGWVAAATAEKYLTDAATANYPAIAWTTTCADGKRVVVGGKGTTFTCTLSVANNPGQSEEHTVTVSDDAGAFTVA